MVKKAKKRENAAARARRPPSDCAADNTQHGHNGDDMFTVVGIGASAGGLAAIKKLLGHVPKDSGLAFVVVVHLSPEHKSHLPELLQPHVGLPVQQVTQTVPLKRNCVYIIPPNANLDSIDTHLRLTELESQRQTRAPIDHFFRTLARTHGPHAIGVVLSGTGTDGTLGLREIKDGGGLTIVQDPDEAEYDGMPRSAIAAVAVDMIAPLAEIPTAAIRFAHTNPSLSVPAGDEKADPEAHQVLHKVLTHVRTRSGRDFSQYKRSTILRRISRRMQFNHIREPAAYLDLLRERPEEVRALADDLLVNVTSFFRDSHVFDALADSVIPGLFEGRAAGDEVRIWSVGCATGEEAYSFAILLAEEAQRRDAAVPAQIFATDLHEASLARAREGIYPGDIATDVSPERLRRFFHEENGSYRVRKELRELVIFAPHNLLSDPPFSRLDLVSCRNLLIYLDRGLHQQVAELFHYALKPGGFIVLGTSDSVDANELFHVVDKESSLHQRRNVPVPEPRLQVFPLAQKYLGSKTPQLEPLKAPLDYSTLQQRIVAQHAPPSLLLGPDDNVLNVAGRAGRYLLQPEGPVTPSVLKLVRQELRIEAHWAISEARRTKRKIHTKPVPVRFNGEQASVALEVRPALEEDQEGFVVVLFDEVETAGQRPGTDAGERITEQDASEVQQLRQDKRALEERLHHVIEEHDTSREELRASYEEMHSANEELRSTLEELETSKEELQSINEELQTVNQENRHKVEELAQLSGDLQNLLVATDIATLFLDRDGKILRFTPKVGELFNIQASDRGRSLSDFTTRLGHAGIAEDASAVLARLVPIDREVQDVSGRWYLTRVLPYRDTEDRIGGVVITFVEITNLKQAEEQARLAKETSEGIIESLPEPLLVLTAELKVHSANASFYEHFGVEPEETLGRKVYNLGNRQWNIPELRDLLERILPEEHHFTGYEVKHRFEHLGERVMVLNGRQLDHLNLILLGIHDITARYEAELALMRSEEQFRALTNASSEVLYRMSPDWKEMRQLHSRGFLTTTEQPNRDWLEAYIPVEERARVWEAIERAIATKERFELEHRIHRADGSVGWTSSCAVPLLDERGETVEWFGAASDITTRKEAEESLMKANLELAESDRRKDEFLAMLGHELRTPLGAMRNATELLKQVGLEDERLNRAVGVLRRQSSHVSRIIDGLLDATRIARGKIDLHLEPVDVREVVEAVLQVRQPHAQARGLELKTDLGSEPLRVMGDEARLSQVFDNLVGNAIKFTQAPGRVTVSVRRDGDSAEIRVRDTGVGIRPEILARIFEAFEQEKQDVARESGGLGIGLSLAKGLVDLHQGAIEAHSAGLGRGAELVVRLPLTSAPEKKRSDPPDESAAPLRILIVEDSADAAQMLRDLLSISGHDVAIAKTGQEALDVLWQRSFDVVLCDVGLPGMSGYEVARAVRKNSALDNLPLIALTGYGQDDDKQRTADAGFNQHLTKPVGLEAVNKALRHARKGR